MKSHRRNVVIGILGTKLDSAEKRDRWRLWRPTIAICQHEELLIDRFELLHQASEEKLAEEVIADIAMVSPETVVRRHLLQLTDPWDFEEVFGQLHDYARRYEFRTESEDYLIHITTGTHVEQICLFLLAESRHLPGRLLQTSPPSRGQTSAGRYTTIDLDLSKYDALATRFSEERAEGSSYLKSGIETKNGAFNALIDRIEYVATHSAAPIFLTGPTGAGKSQLARRIYDLKRKREQIAGEFVEVNCATLRGDQAMSALFGHIKGAYTGSAGARPGLLKTADNGLLFLDEIGELGLDEQAMLLRAIEEKRFLPVGADLETMSDFQLIAGTNRDLRQGVETGDFREDLWTRINLWTFRLPSLAERREDIPPNLEYEMDRCTVVLGRKITMNKEARDAFLEFAHSPGALWTANFRDLNAAVLRMATLAPAGRITLDLVQEEADRLLGQWRMAESSDDDLSQFLSPENLEKIDLFDRMQLLSVIRVCRESRSLSEAGRTLFAVSRQEKKLPNDADRLRKYLIRFGLEWSTVVAR